MMPAEVIEKLSKLAPLLGGEFCSESQIISLERDGRILCRMDKGQLRFIGLFDNCGSAHRERHTIGVNPNRSEYSIAKDLKNRLLTSYLPALKQARIDAGNIIAKNCKKQLLNQELSLILDAKKDHYSDKHYFEFMGNGCNFEHWYNGDYNLKLRVDHETAVLLAHYLRCLQLQFGDKKKKSPSVD